MNRTEEVTQLERMAVEFRERSETEIFLAASTWGIMSILTLIGNFITLLIIFRNRGLWTPTNMFIASLALSDFGFAVFSVVVLGTTTLASREWPFSWTACQYQGFIVIVMAAASIETLGCTAVNRFYRVVKPSLYKRYFSKKTSAAIICLSWLLAFLAPVPYVTFGNTFVFHPAKAFCYLQIDSGVFTIFLVSTYIGIPATTICYCYLRVFFFVRKHKQQIMTNCRLSASEIKITKTLFIIVFVFMCCWTPVLAIDVIDTVSGRWGMPRWLYVTYSYLTLISSCVNPVIYVIMNPVFRNEYIKLLKCSHCTKKVVEPAAERTCSNDKEVKN